MSTDPSTNPANPSDPLAIDWSPYRYVSFVAIVVGVATFAAGAAVHLSSTPEEMKHIAQGRFMAAYLTGYTYWLSLPIGAMALLWIAYLTKTSWGLLLRRPLEAATRTWPLLALLFVPLVISVAVLPDFSPYWWTAPENAPVPPNVNSANPGAGVDANDKRQLAVKYGEYMIQRAIFNEREARARGTINFLSPASFIGVGIGLYAIWGTMIWFLNKWGTEAQGSREQVDKSLASLNKYAGPGLIIFALTITVAATQWVMSVEPSWSSTMFPVIFAVNQFLTCYAFCLAIFLVVASRPPIKNVMRPKFQIDMATLMLAFTLFWTYTSFSQFMLIWVGNLPEEIPFYLKRSAGGWWWVSAGLAVFHFAVPFMLLLFRDIKMHPRRLRFMAMYLMIVCAVDVIWWIAPAAQPISNFAWVMDIGAILAIGGVWGLVFFWQLSSRSILPTDQTFLLPEGHDHEHH